MGISKAILDNVIFVHQEDANWPLRESKVLVRPPRRRPGSARAISRRAAGGVQKQKFDDIFSATRYSKALDAIKKLRKEKMDEVKDQKIQLAEKKARVDAKQDILKRKRQQETQIAELKQQLVESGEDFEDAKRVRPPPSPQPLLRPNALTPRRPALETRKAAQGPSAPRKAGQPDQRPEGNQGRDGAEQGAAAGDYRSEW